MTPRQHGVPVIFGQRIKRERERRGWSLRDLAGKCGHAAPSTPLRAEQGHDLWLSSALAIAAAFGLPLGEMLAEPECAHCDGKPPTGWICPKCRREGAA